MSLEPKTNSWQPTTRIETLAFRAKTLATIRTFFAARKVMEVETGLLAASGVTDIHIQPICAKLQRGGHLQTCYLQTSPEYMMKRLLAAGSGAIYQICKAFRNEEQGRLHHPEFTMVEWYRPGFSYQDLMDEVSDLLATLTQGPHAKKCRYEDVFLQYLGFNPHQISLQSLREELNKHSISVHAPETLEINDILDLLFHHFIEPHLVGDAPWIIYDYPASMAALATIRHDAWPVAERFEVYYQGLELANGYDELTCPTLQRKRFEADLQARVLRGLPEIPIDEALLAAMESGLPACAGVALGFDRLCMAMLNAQSIEEVIPFLLP